MTADWTLPSSTLTNIVGRNFLINLKTTQKSVEAEGSSPFTQQLSLVPIPSQTNPPHTHPVHFVNVQYNITSLSVHGYSLQVC